jgi:hypothetical protein
LIAGVTAGLMTLASDGISRAWAGVIGILIFVGVVFALNRMVPEPLARALGRIRAHDRKLAAAAYAGFVAPLLLFVYALVGGLVPLVVAIVPAAAAALLIRIRR